MLEIYLQHRHIHPIKNSNKILKHLKKISFLNLSKRKNKSLLNKRQNVIFFVKTF